MYTYAILYLQTHFYPILCLGTVNRYQVPHLPTAPIRVCAGWEGKFRGLVLEAIWPLVFGAQAWQPTEAWSFPGGTRPLFKHLKGVPQ